MKVSGSADGGAAMLDNMCAKAYNSLREWEWNCSWMFMYYDMGLRYLTPTVNLSIEMNDFVKMVRNLKWYMEQEMTEAQEPGYKCPVGILGDIRICFIHYASFEEGARRWEERKRRINWDKLLIIGSG